MTDKPKPLILSPLFDTAAAGQPPRERDVIAERLAMARGYGLATAEILYRLPDHPSILQTYIWQDYDIMPKFPALNKFLDFWKHELDGALYAVRVDFANLLKKADLKMIGSEFRLN